MADEKTEQNMEDVFDGDREREQIRRIGEGMNRLAAHWAYLGDFRGGKSSKEFWTAKHRLQSLCGMREAGDEPDFVENMQGRSLQSLEKSVDAAIKAMEAYEERHSTFFGFLARLFNLVSYARMQDTDIAIRRLQEMKNSIVRLRTHGEDLNGLSIDKTEQLADKEKTVEKTVEKTAEKVKKTTEKTLEESAESPKTAMKQKADNQAEENNQPEKEPPKESGEEFDDELDEILNEPVYDEKAELEFQQMKPEDRSPIKEKNGNTEFYPRYDQFISDYPDREKQINSNKIKDLKDLNRDLGETDPELRSYLEQRINNLKKIRKLEIKSEENFKQRQTKAPLIVKNANDETTKVMLPDVTQPQMQHTLAGCWAVSISSMLRQKGVEMDQETIRAFRPDPKNCMAQDLRSANGDRCNSIDMSKELIMKVLPDTALNSVQASVNNFNTFDNNHPWMQWSEKQKDEKRDEFKNKMRDIFKRSLETDKGSLAILMKDHYRTVYGYEKVTENGKEVEYVYLHDPNDPNKEKMTLDELADEGYKTNQLGEEYSLDAHWLQDLTNDKGEVALDTALTEKGVTYEDHKLKCANLVSNANQSNENTNWRTLKYSMGEDVTITTFLPATVKNLAKNRILDPAKPSEFGQREKNPVVTNAQKHEPQKVQSDLLTGNKQENSSKIVSTKSM